MTQDILLSSGRTIVHRKLPNGANEATPATGPAEMTADEWREYCDAVVAIARQQRARCLVIPGRPTYRFS